MGVERPRRADAQRNRERLLAAAVEAFTEDSGEVTMESIAKRAGLDIGKVIDTISKGAAQSWQMENRWKTMVEGRFDFGFAVDLVRKDFALVFDEARRNGAELPVTALVDQFYAEVQAMGGNRWDTSSLIALLERKP